VDFARGNGNDRELSQSRTRHHRRLSAGARPRLCAPAVADAAGGSRPYRVSGTDFADAEKWLPLNRLLINYVAEPYPDAQQCQVMQEWLEGGGHWLALHDTSRGRAEPVDGMRQRRTFKMEHHALLGS
jgi:hypothetical protein